MQCAFSSHEDEVSFSVLLGRGGGASLALQNIVAAISCETEDRHCCLVYSPKNIKCLNLSGKHIFPPAFEGVSPHAINLQGGVEAWLHSFLNLAVCSSLQTPPSLLGIGSRYNLNRRVCGTRSVYGRFGLENTSWSAEIQPLTVHSLV
jgi:hypothetical protein